MTSIATTGEIMQFRLQVADLLARGLSLHQIRNRLGLHGREVETAKAWLDDYWLSQIDEQLPRFKADLLNKHAHIYRQALDSWERSKETGETTTKTSLRRKGKDGKIEGATDADSIEQQSISEKHPGDPRYLDVAGRALRDIATLTGANAPVKYELDGDAQTVLLQLLPTLSIEEVHVMDAAFERYEEIVKEQKALPSPNGDGKANGEADGNGSS